MNATERRSAALLFGEELALGEVDPAALDTPEVEEAVRDRPVPSRAARWVQKRQLAKGSLDYEQVSVAPMLAARAAVLGERAAGPPRFLLRVDGLAAAGDDALLRGHELLLEHEVPYLLSVEPHTVGGLDLLRRLRRDGVVFGISGPGEDALGPYALAPDVFVPPGDELDPDEYAAIAKRFAVITGGPSSVPTFGWHPTPLWRADAVYCPAYLAGARAATAAARRLIDAGAALWVPLAVRWPDEPEEDLAELCRALRGYARDWEEFLAAVRASR